MAVGTLIELTFNYPEPGWDDVYERYHRILANNSFKELSITVDPDWLPAIYKSYQYL